jgi:hypothetical protein
VAGPEANESVVPATTAGSATLALASNRQATAGFAKPEGILDWTRHTDTPGTHGRSMSVGSYGLVLLVINCGRGGITTAAEAILTLVAWLQSCQQLIVDVILLNELHLLTGTCVVIPGYDLHWRPRPNSLLGCPSGGVGFAVRHGLELVSPPKLCIAVQLEILLPLNCRWHRTTSRLYLGVSTCLQTTTVELVGALIVDAARHIWKQL